MGTKRDRYTGEIDDLGRRIKESSRKKEKASSSAAEKAPKISNGMMITTQRYFEKMSEKLNDSLTKISDQPTVSVGDSVMFPEDNRDDVISVNDFGRALNVLPNITVTYPADMVKQNFLAKRGVKPEDGDYVEQVTFTKTDGLKMTLFLDMYREDKISEIGFEKIHTWEKRMNSWRLVEYLDGAEMTVDEEMRAPEYDGSGDSNNMNMVSRVFSSVLEWAGTD